MRQKVVYIISFLEKSLPMEWVVMNLDRTRYDLSFIMIGKENTPFIRFLEAQHVPCTVVPYNAKKDLLSGFFRILRLLRRLRPEVVHVHLFYAGMIGIPAAWMAGVRRRIYTRHYSTYHHDFYPKGVYIDRFINFLSTKVVAISPVVEKVLVAREHVPPAKVLRIPHGFDFSYFTRQPAEAEAARTRYHIPADAYPVVGVISRYIKLKGIQYIIEAFAALRKQYPKAHLVLGNAQGDYKPVLAKQLAGLPAETYTEILFEENVRALYAMFDVFVHVPITPEGEAFGQIYVEALAMKVPSVFTLSGIAREFVEDRVHARVVPYENADAIREATVDLLEDAGLRATLATRGYEAVVNEFGMPQMIRRLDAAYCED